RASTPRAVSRRPIPIFPIVARRDLRGSIRRRRDRRSNIRPPEQIVEAADAIPAITVGLERDRMLAVPARAAVVGAQQVDEQTSDRILDACRKLHLACLASEIVQEQHRIVAPVVAHAEYGIVAGRENLEFSPADLRHLLAHADYAL